MSHTPGPWEVWHPDEYGSYSVGRESGASIAHVFRSNHEDNVADNARLIAAAPDLLTALEEFIRLFDEPVSQDLWTPAYDQGRTAIAKATDET